jgi:hypothetical protein
MSFEYGKAVMKIAIGIGGGFAVMEVITPNDYLMTDVKEYGQYPDDLFYNGSEPPKEPGIYIFDGVTHIHSTGGGEWWHKGEFKKVGHDFDENHPQFAGVIRALWRRIEPHKNKYGKELPSELPVEFRASMATALALLKSDKND